MISNNNVMNKQALIVFVVTLPLAANVGVSGQNSNDCKQAGLSLNHLYKYQNIMQEITNTSCALSQSSFGKGRVYPSNNLKLSNIFLSFSATCRRYTDILALKDQLQKVLFDSNETLSSEILLQLTSLIINLQTAAKNLQYIEIKQHNRYCVTFASPHYELIYLSRLHKADVASSLCKTARVLQSKNEACKNWPNYD